MLPQAANQKQGRIGLRRIFRESFEIIFDKR
jgi:hypothetical protein